jgi:hypothetical protein
LALKRGFGECFPIGVWRAMDQRQLLDMIQIIEKTVNLG